MCGHRQRERQRGLESVWARECVGTIQRTLSVSMWHALRSGAHRRVCGLGGEAIYDFQGREQANTRHNQNLVCGLERARLHTHKATRLGARQAPYTQGYKAWCSLLGGAGPT